MQKLLIATHNLGKFEDIKNALRDISVEIISLDDLNISDKPEESAKTLEENAILKAKFYAGKTGMITLADDTGLEIDALGGEPGVRVRRWAGHEMTDEELIQYTLEKLKNVPYENRGAQFRTVVAIFNPQTNEVSTFDGILRGIILEKADPLRISGLPFESLFFIPEYNKVVGKLTKEEKNKIKHRAKAVKTAIPRIKEIFKV